MHDITAKPASSFPPAASCFTFCTVFPSLAIEDDQPALHKIMDMSVMPIATATISQAFLRFDITKTSLHRP